MAFSSDAIALHDALMSIWARLYQDIDGARFERRSDLIVVVCPTVPIPQFNGPWVVQDSEAAVAALPAAVAEVEATGAVPWVQTRSHQHRVQDAARRLGLTEVERIPGMLARPGELEEADVGLEIGPIANAEVEETNRILSVSFEGPEELFVRLGAIVSRVPEATWYVGRLHGSIVSTAIGVTVGGATAIFNVATPPEHRGHGYGSALTARVARDGFAAGSQFAFLQSSDAGHGVYRRLGFHDVEEYVLLTRPALG